MNLLFPFLSSWSVSLVKNPPISCTSKTSVLPQLQEPNKERGFEVECHLSVCRHSLNLFLFYAFTYLNPHMCLLASRPGVLGSLSLGIKFPVHWSEEVVLPWPHSLEDVTGDRSSLIKTWKEPPEAILAAHSAFRDSWSAQLRSLSLVRRRGGWLLLVPQLFPLHRVSFHSSICFLASKPVFTFLLWFHPLFFFPF